MIIGYARVSSHSQDLDLQIETLEQKGCQFIYREKYTGTTRQRPELIEMMDVLRKGDTLIVVSLDRLARNTKEGIEIIETLFKRGVAIHVLNIGLLENTTMGKFFLQSMLAVAEMERNLILDRMRAGREKAKQRNDFVEGRPKKFKKKQIAHALELLDKNHTYREVEAMTGISISTLSRAKTKRDAEQFDESQLQ